MNRAKLEKELDKAWSEYVRKRDKRCRKCGGNGAVSAHHAFGRRHKATRWDVFNGISLCYACHIHWAHRDPSGFTYWFQNQIPVEQYDRISEAHLQIFKPTTEELKRMLDDLKEMICQLRD